jgi:hypothetical protein
MSNSSTSSSNWRGLLLRAFLLALPLGLMLGSYVWLDPFRVLWRYERFYEPPTPVALDRDFVTTELFLSGHQNQKWDSFIFGSSRSLAFQTADFHRYLDADAKVFHFDAAGESLFGVHGKVKLIERTRTKLRNVLLVVDASLLQEAGDTTAHMQIKHPSLSGQSFPSFQAHFLRAYFYDFFAFKYMHYRLIGKVLPYMSDVLDPHVFTFSWPGNDIFFTGAEQEIASDGAKAYAARRARMFRRREPAMNRPVIQEKQRQMLAEIAHVFAEQGSAVRVVVSPLYDQRALNPKDLAELRSLFGAERVLDFSGVNSVTSDALNYYDDSHYKVAVARRIMTCLYPSREPPLTDAAAAPDPICPPVP